MVKNKKYFGLFLVSYISIQKKKCTSEQFLQGRPNVPLYTPLITNIFSLYTVSKQTKVRGLYPKFVADKSLMLKKMDENLVV